jgi:prepilin-type N-terminal cleavage/methylation domain-containing protein
MGYTLVEIMIVTAIIAVILSIVIPNFLRAGAESSKNACKTNLKQIDGALEQWAFDKNVYSGVTLNSEQEDEVYAYVDGGCPKCPSKGEYMISSTGSNPSVKCSREDLGHALS